MKFFKKPEQRCITMRQEMPAMQEAFLTDAILKNKRIEEAGFVAGQQAVKETWSNLSACFAL